MKPTKKSLFPFYKKTDISMEQERHYVFPGGDEVVIQAPQFIIVSDNGHRVFDGEISHYVPYGWVHLWWKNTPDMVDRGEGFFCQEGMK
jgi:hypothetical protein